MSDPAITTAVALCTVEQVKARANIRTIGSDDLIADEIPVVLDLLNVRLGREMMPWVTETRTFDVTGQRVALYGCDLRTVTTLTLHPENEALVLIEGTDFTLDLERLTNTAGSVVFARSVSLRSAFSSRFGHARVAIAGAWGIWQQLSAVPEAVNKAAIDCVLSRIDQGASNLAGVDVMTARGVMPGNGTSWDIPASAYRKLQPYNRNLGAY